MKRIFTALVLAFLMTGCVTRRHEQAAVWSAKMSGLIANQQAMSTWIEKDQHIAANLRKMADEMSNEADALIISADRTADIATANYLRTIAELLKMHAGALRDQAVLLSL